METHELHFEEGPARGRSCAYDIVRRRAVDAVVLVAFARRPGGGRDVFLRSALRPPLALRDDGVPIEAGLWELPAGLVEPGESPAVAAARELEEELGFAVSPEALRLLGAPVLPAPALIAERQFGFAVDVTDLEPRDPGLDGSLIELGGAIVRIEAGAAVRALAEEGLVDAKTELFLNRFLQGEGGGSPQ